MDNIYFGSVNIYIREIIACVRQFYPYPIPVIKTLDSSQDSGLIRKATYNALGHKLATAQDIIDLDTMDFFQGFDEIWMCTEQGVEKATRSGCPQLTSDCFDYADKISPPSDIVDLMRRNDVVCVISNGFSTNYICGKKHLAEQIRNL